MQKTADSLVAELATILSAADEAQKRSSRGRAEFCVELAFATLDALEILIERPPSTSFPELAT